MFNYKTEFSSLTVIYSKYARELYENIIKTVIFVLTILT